MYIILLFCCFVNPSLLVFHFVSLLMHTLCSSNTSKVNFISRWLIWKYVNSVVFCGFLFCSSFVILGFCSFLFFLFWGSQLCPFIIQPVCLNVSRSYFFRFTFILIFYFYHSYLFPTSFLSPFSSGLLPLPPLSVVCSQLHIFMFKWCYRWYLSLCLSPSAFALHGFLSHTLSNTILWSHTHTYTMCVCDHKIVY